MLKTCMICKVESEKKSTLDDLQKIHSEKNSKGIIFSDNITKSQGLEDDGDEGVKVDAKPQSYHNDDDDDDFDNDHDYNEFHSQDLIEMTMKKMDEDKDGKVSFADFEVDIITVQLL